MRRIMAVTTVILLSASAAAYAYAGSTDQKNQGGFAHPFDHQPSDKRHNMC